MSDEYEGLAGGVERDAVPPSEPRTGRPRRPPGGQYHPDGRVRGSAEPVPGRCGRRLKDSDPPRYCTQWPLKGRDCCKYCGGKSPAGVASPHWRNGSRSRYMKHLPQDLKAAHEQALADENLESLRDELALLTNRTQEVLDRLSAAPPPPWRGRPGPSTP